MSRIGKKEIPLPDKVKVKVEGGVFFVEGPLGKLSVPMNELITVETSPKAVVLKRKEDTKDGRRLHGLMRALMFNLVKGVSEGFQRNLEIEGVGYRAEVKGNDVHMTLGYSHPIVYPLPSGVKASVEKQTKLTLTGPDKTVLGQAAADIRAFRGPEPYKGKGIRYSGEVIERKAGKSAASGGK